MPGAALPALGMNFNALKRSFCFGLLASVHVRDHVRAVVREKLQRSTTANSIVPCSTFFAAHHRVSKMEFFEWLRQDQFTSFHDITNWYFMNSGQDYEVLLFSSWHQKSCFMCVLTLCEWLIIRFDLKTNSKQQLFYKIFCIKSNQKNVRRLKSLLHSNHFYFFNSMYCLRDKYWVLFIITISFLVSN